MAEPFEIRRMQQRRGTEAQWTATNPVLLAGEIGVRLDPPLGFKIGDGVTAWNELPYFGGHVITPGLPPTP